MLNSTCINCSGGLTRSKYAPDQPSNSPFCAVCWYNQQENSHPLLTLDELDELLSGVSENVIPLLEKALVGQFVDWHGDIGVFVLINEALRIEVDFACTQCGGSIQTYYAGPGLHAGAWPYIHDAQGNMLGNVRDHEYQCMDCLKKRAK